MDSISKGSYEDVYQPCEISYKPGMGYSRYSTALRQLIPVRKTQVEKAAMPVDKVGMLSFVTFSWMTRIMWHAYKKGLQVADLPRISPLESCEYNARRLEFMWIDEVKRHGLKRASFRRAIWRFVRTRIFVGMSVFVACLVMGLLGPTVFMRRLLEYAQDADAPLSEGIYWTVGLILCEALRVCFFTALWGINYRTGIRLRSACLTVLYRKLLRLPSIGDKSVGQVVNLFANDAQRIFDLCVFGPMIIGGPVIALGGVIYIGLLLGPHALLGMVVFILFYPFQFGLSRITGYLRRKTIIVTDERVRLMNEILTSIKLIKQYAWEATFAQRVTSVRASERALLQKAAYVQSVSIALAPTVPVIAAIITFLAHVGAGNDLTAAQAFTVLSYMFKVVRPSLGILRIATSAIWDADSAFERTEAFTVLTFMNRFVSFALVLLREGTRVLWELDVTLERAQAFSILAFMCRLGRYVLVTMRASTHALWEADISLPRTQAFTVIGFYMRMCPYTLNVLRLISQQLAECAVTMARFQAFTVTLNLATMKPLLSSISSALTNYYILKETAARVQVWSVIAISGLMNNTLRWSANLKECLEALLGVDRYQSILLMEEQQSYVTVPEDVSLAVVVQNATFAWDFSRDEDEEEGGAPAATTANGHAAEAEALKPPSPLATKDILHDIDLVVPKGKLVGICGAVGSGKSSLLEAMLGLMRLNSGQVALDGSCAYVCQQPWILNATLKENIRFGHSFDAKRYFQALRACSLHHDVTTLPGGDETEIGERGINLSGGQKQRVALARALYADREIYLLDDPLAAVDSHVGKHIFQEYIQEALKDKTVLFVTHQLQYLSQCDTVCLMRDGRIVESGPHARLMSAGGEYSALITTYVDEQQREEEDPGADSELVLEAPSKSTLDASAGASRRPSWHQGEATRRRSSHSAGQSHHSLDKVNPVSPSGADAADADAAAAGQLTVAEKLEAGAISGRTYKAYIQSGGGFFVAALVLVVFILNVGSSAFSSWWLSHWLKQGSGNTTVTLEGNVTVVSPRITDNPDLDFYQLVYGLSVVIILVTSLIRGFFFMKVTLKASSTLHDRLFHKILRAPMILFDTTPIGRLLNLLSRDLDEIDVRLPFTAETFIQNSLMILVSLLFVALVFPWFLLPLLLIAVIFIAIRTVYNTGVRDLKRLENVTRAPTYSHVITTVQGLGTIHAFGKEREFTNRFMGQFDENSSAFYLFNCSMRWVAIRLDSLTVTITALTSVFVLLTHGSVPAAFAGLALAYAAQLSGLFQFTVRLSSETEARFTSVERIDAYTASLDQEAAPVVPDRRPAADWPRSGRVTFNKVCLRYRPELPTVLNSISFEVNAEEKIGIVGRTGSGKSSIGVALFRLVEPQSGQVLVDGVDVATVGLEDLRSRLSIIPQDPVLFVGTVRYNLDPYGYYSDAQVWQALERTHMKQKIGSLERQLEAPVMENGENFSVGERQLICMARALLRHSKILLMDEATASIDTETDALIQTTIREAFSSCTLLTIAHRLNTVLASSRVLVLDSGRVVEFDKPSVLLARPNSVFAGMVAAANAATDAARDSAENDESAVTPSDVSTIVADVTPHSPESDKPSEPQ